MEGKIEKIRQYFEYSQRNDLEISKHQILKKIMSFEKSVPSFNLNHGNRDTSSEDFICKYVKSDILSGYENVKYTLNDIYWFKLNF